MFSKENQLRLYRKLVIPVLVFFVLIISCNNPLPGPDPEELKAPALTIAINEFIEDVMNDIYLWYKELPAIDPRYEFDSKVYFKKLLYTEDKWSFVTDDAKKLEDSFKGKETSYGWSLAFGRFSDTKNIFALVEFVYPNTPADKAGFKRGDLIYKMTGADIQDNNYMELLTSANLTCTYGQYGPSGISNIKTVSMTALELNLDPVQFTKIIEHGGRKIGYLFYAQFISNYNSSIDAALQSFMDAKVTDVILDLRYNPGGTTVAAQHLCSSLAPLNVVNDQKTLVKFKWNDKFQKHWEDKNNQSQLGISFVKTVPLKLGLSKLYVITGSGTASASELSITGLKPYMNVKTIGEITYGKYTASITIKPEDLYEKPADYKGFENWAVQPIILTYTNVLGVTDFKNGFNPDIPVNDDLFSNIPLGDKTETMLKKAIEDITGVQVVAMKSAEITREYTIFDRGFSKYDANKRELLIDGFDISLMN